jgi:hypothetical protein
MKTALQSPITPGLSFYYSAMEWLGGRGAVVGRGKKGYGDDNQVRSEVGGLGKQSLNFAGRSTAAYIRLLVVHYADRAVVMIGAVIVMMERCHQSGEENEAYEKKRKTLGHLLNPLTE